MNIMIEQYILKPLSSVQYDYNGYAHTDNVPVIMENTKPQIFPTDTQIYEYFDKLKKLSSKEEKARMVYILRINGNIYKIICPVSINDNCEIENKPMTLFTNNKIAGTNLTDITIAIKILQEQLVKDNSLHR